MSNSGFATHAGGTVDPTISARVATLENGTGSTTAGQQQVISALAYGLIALDIPLDTGTSTGSNLSFVNGIQSVRYNNDDSAPSSRFIAGPLHGYVTGSHVWFRMHYALTGSGLTNDSMRWTFDYAFIDTNDTLPASYDYSITTDFGLEGIQLKTWQCYDFVISASTVEGLKNSIAMRLTRNSSDNNDTYGGDVSVLKMELLYSGWGISINAPIGGS